MDSTPCPRPCGWQGMACSGMPTLPSGRQTSSVMRSLCSAAKVASP